MKLVSVDMRAPTAAVPASFPISGRAVRIVTALALVALGSSAVIIAIARADSRAATLVLSAALFVGPGLAATAVTGSRWRSVVTWAIPISLAFMCLLVRALFALNLYRPRPVAASIGVALVVAGVLVLARADDRFHGSESPGPSVASPASPVGLDLPSIRLTWAISTAVALAAWLVGLARTDQTDLIHWGLLGTLSPFWYIGLLAVVVSAVAGARLSTPTNAGRLSLSVLALILYLHATWPMLFQMPRYAWTFKHVGIADFMAVNFDNSRAAVDIYQAWPSFFGAVGVVGGSTSSLGLADLARWWPLAIQLAIALVARVAFSAVIADARVVWTAVGLLAVGNWVGQDYFSPQSIGFLLSIALAAVVLCRLVPPRSDLRRGKFGVLAADSWRPHWFWSVAALCLFAAIVVTHQLSPYLVLPGLVLAVPLLGMRPKLLPLGFAILAFGYALLNYDIVQRQGVGNSIGAITENVETRGFSARTRLPEFDRYYESGIALSAVLCIAAVLGIWALRRRVGPQWLGIAALAASPGLVLTAESYGHEGALRAYLFALPWVALLAGSLVFDLIDRTPRTRWLRTAPIVGVLAAVVALGTVTDFVRDLDYHVQPSDVRMSYWWEHNSPQRSVMVSSGIVALPSRITSEYFLRSYRGLTERVVDADGGFDPDASLDATEAAAREARNSADWYIGFGPTIVDRSYFDGYLAPSDVAALRAVVESRPEWTLVYSGGDSRLFRWTGT